MYNVKYTNKIYIPEPLLTRHQAPRPELYQIKHELQIGGKGKRVIRSYFIITNYPVKCFIRSKDKLSILLSKISKIFSKEVFHKEYSTQNMRENKLVGSLPGGSTNR